MYQQIFLSLSLSRKFIKFIQNVFQIPASFWHFNEEHEIQTNVRFSYYIKLNHLFLPRYSCQKNEFFSLVYNNELL